MASHPLAPAGTLPGVLERAPRTAAALIEKEARLTYGELLDAARSVANGLAALPLNGAGKVDKPLLRRDVEFRATRP